MEMSPLKPVRFIANNDQAFGKTLRKRVNEYFKSNNISKTGDYRIWIKVIAMPLLYLAPFVLIMTNLFSNNLFVFYGLWILMGVGLAGVGAGIMHDACHSSISKNATVNKIISMVINLGGGYALNWKIQHNVLHHTYTNVTGYDEDIDPSGIMRFTPHQPLKPAYKFQVFYAWFFYGLMTFAWTTFKDFRSLIRYQKMDLVKAQGTNFGKELTKLILLKIGYYLVFMVLPIIFLDIAWWQIVLGWFSMHFTAGLILGCVFQAAHVVPNTEFPKPDAGNNIKGDWAKYQLLTTANFAPKSKVLAWFIGGLNHQIEHHLFPNICHVHYPELSKIVKQTAVEYNLPYISEPTFVGALINHGKVLYRLGR